MTPRPRPAPRRAAAGLLGLVAAVVLSGCSVFPGPGQAQQTDQDGHPLPVADASGYTPAPLYFVALNGEFPPNTRGRDVACEDLLVRVDTVPVQTDDLVATSIGFLLDDEQYSHGDPAVTNSLDPSEDGLAYSSYRIEGDTVVVELSGEVVSRSQCESLRIRAQLNRTAAAAAGVQDAEILVDGVRIEEILWLDEMELGEEVVTPPADTPEEDGSPAGDGSDEATGAPGPTDGAANDPTDEIGDPEQLNDD